MAILALVGIAAYQVILVFRDTADLALADIAVLVFQDIQEHQAGLASLAGQAIQALAVHQALQVGLVIVVIADILELAVIAVSLAIADILELAATAVSLATLASLDTLVERQQSAGQTHRYSTTTPGC